MTESTDPTQTTNFHFDVDLTQLSSEQRAYFLRMDLCRRWQTGRKVTVGSYLLAQPQLRQDRELVLDLLSLEISLRQGEGELIDVSAIVQQFPELRDDLELRLALYHTFSTSPGSVVEAELSQDNTPVTKDYSSDGSVSDAEPTLQQVTKVVDQLQQTQDPDATLPNHKHFFTPIQVIGDYEILEELGRGGMGVVYKARQKRLGRLVALKMILRAEIASPSQRQRFEREAQAIALLQHPNVVQIFEIGEHAGNPFFSLELVEGGSLDRQLREKPFSAKEAALLVETLARAVQVAHEAGVVHRDLKPANVLLTESKAPKITDFGLAKRIEETGGTHEGALVGTPSYMAPEQARGKTKEVGPATDTYALGAILYECLTGRPPFRAADVMTTLYQVTHDEPVTPLRAQPGTPKALETICLKCLQKEPNLRYVTAEDLADDLRRYLENKPIHARPASMTERVMKWIKRNPVVSGLLVTVMLMLVVGLSVVTWKWRQEVSQRKRAQTAEVSERQAHGRTRQMEVELTDSLVYLSAFARDVAAAQLRFDRRELAKAIEAIERAAIVVEKRLGREESPRLRESLVRSYAFLGVLHLKQGEQKKASAYFRKAVKIVAGLTDVKPEALASSGQYGETCYVLGVALRTQGDYDGALILTTQAVRHLQRAVEKSPDQLSIRQAASRAYFELGHVQRTLGRVRDAATTAMERKKLWPNNPNEIYDVACELSRCAGAVGKGKKELTKAEREERDKYGAQVVVTLREALKKGLTGPESITADKDFVHVRDRVDFQQLLREVQKR